MCLSHKFYSLICILPRYVYVFVFLLFLLHLCFSHSVYLSEQLFTLFTQFTQFWTVRNNTETFVNNIFVYFFNVLFFDLQSVSFPCFPCSTSSLAFSFAIHHQEHWFTLVSPLTQFWKPINTEVFVNKLLTSSMSSWTSHTSSSYLDLYLPYFRTTIYTFSTIEIILEEQKQHRDILNNKFVSFSKIWFSVLAICPISTFHVFSNFLLCLLHCIHLQEHLFTHVRPFTHYQLHPLSSHPSIITSYHPLSSSSIINFKLSSYHFPCLLGFLIFLLLNWTFTFHI